MENRFGVLFEPYNFKIVDTVNYCDGHLSWIFSNSDTCIIIDNNICQTSHNVIFDYSTYCETQNIYMKKYSKLFRFNYKETDSKTFVEYIISFINKDISSVELIDDGGSFSESHVDNTPLEHKFEEIFNIAYGKDAVMYLKKEFAVSLADGKKAFIDYVIETCEGNFAIEENGVNYHHPCLIGNDAYDRQLLKQNYLVLLNFKVYRFSTQNMLFKEQIVDYLQKYLGKKENFINSSIVISDRKFELYDHQKNVLSDFEMFRKNDIKSALVVLPTGTGKSQIVISDLEKLESNIEYKNVLIMVPSVRTKNDWINRVRFVKGFNIEIVTYNAAYLKRNAVDKEYYDYIVFDEAHHAQAANCKKTLQYFNPKFLVGLTATDERLDKKKLEDIFGRYETKLTLKEAIEKKIVSNIRMYRLESNIDLSKVRYNGVDYNYSDLERTLVVDSRNELIASTILKYFEPKEDFYKQGIVFCVNINHVKKMEKLLNLRGIKAKAVYGGNKDNDINYKLYEDKKIQFLISCQVISEGWDSPQTEIVIMARPTLSKVLYMQQLGRGVRNYKGKECLYVVDVVDNYEGKLTPWSCNSLFKIASYSDFQGVVNNNFDYLSILGLVETEIALKELDVFTFEEKYKDYKSLEETARYLFVGTNTLHKWVKDNPDYSSLYLPIGSRIMPYFSSEDIAMIQKAKNLKEHNKSTILNDFIEFVDDNNLTFSYKLIFLLNIFKLANNEGEIVFSDLATNYREFYLNRIAQGLRVDRKGCPFTKEYLLDETKLKHNILENPFEKFERKRFIYFSKDLNVFAINPDLWNDLTETIKKETVLKLNNFLDEYYNNLN